MRPQLRLFPILFASLFLSVTAIARPRVQPPCRVLVVTFVGGIGPALFPPTMATPVIQSVRDLRYPGVCLKSVSSSWPWSASHWVRKQFAAARREEDSPGDPKLIVFGYSLGGSHAIRFARAMQRLNIPIELLVTVDIKGPTGAAIPGNVKYAANYYERWMYPLFFPIFYGKKNLYAEDPTKTNFMGNTQILHAGHFQIVRRSNVRQLLCDAVELAYESAPSPAQISRNNSSAAEP